MGEPLIEVRDLVKNFPVKGGVFQREIERTPRRPEVATIVVDFAEMEMRLSVTGPHPPAGFQLALCAIDLVQARQLQGRAKALLKL